MAKRRHVQLHVENLGPIRDARLTFGDLTVLIGPQASGKSISLQLLKLLVDTGIVQSRLRRYGLDWRGSVDVLLDTYFGEGMHSIWDAGKTRVAWQGKSVDLAGIARRKRRDEKETLFLIPAQRVLAMRNGWPLPFDSYSAGDPFTVRDFSEQLRKLVLAQKGNPEGLPQMVWSAGQREFIPLLLGLYWLMPSTKVSRRGDLEWVVIEETEMGLHPRAITGFLLMVLELLRRGYRVCLSTHSTQVLEFAWALRNLQDTNAAQDAVLAMFDLSPNQATRALGGTALKTRIAVHYYDGATGRTHDISRLDPSAPQQFEATWGGLTEFTERANREVAQAAASDRK